ncbi:MAG: penicillin acylase family protein, partial [bacterium]
MGRGRDYRTTYQGGGGSGYWGGGVHETGPYVGGGGGSSWTATDAAGVIHTQNSRSGNGTVTLTAGNDADAARALGYVHAQERYFEMDLLRRSAAGELSALFGEMAVEKDKSIRIHRLRARIRNHFAQMA